MLLTIIFEFIDNKVNERHRRTSHNISVKKFQDNNPEKYKEDNMAAVTNYNSKNPEKHSQQNLATVQKFALENPDKHNKQHLAAVRKYAIDNPDKHSKQHLAAVKNFKLKHPDRHQQQNLSAFQKFKLEHPHKSNQINKRAVDRYRENKKSQFPPDPPLMRLQHTIISDFCQDISPNKFVEAGCAVCGRLTPVSQLKGFLDMDLTPLVKQGITQMERFSIEDPIASLDKPVLIDELDRICKTCYKSLQNDKCPVSSLANGLWLGKVPKELSDLS